MVFSAVGQAHERPLPPERGGADGIGRIEAPDETDEPEINGAEGFSVMDNRPRQLKAGDVVMLMSGGPAMTVYKAQADRVEVDWFVGGALHRDAFHPAALLVMPPIETGT